MSTLVRVEGTESLRALARENLYELPTKPCGERFFSTVVRDNDRSSHALNAERYNRLRKLLEGIQT